MATLGATGRHGLPVLADPSDRQIVSVLSVASIVSAYQVAFNAAGGGCPVDP
jgi:hypothetical protein